MNNFKQIMKEKHRHATRVENTKKSIEHCISMIALCEIGGQQRAKASYEAHPFYDRAEAVACLRDYRRFHGRTLARDREDRAMKRKQAKP